MSTVEMYDAIAKLSEYDEPLLGDAEVVLGDGSTKIHFKKGRARVSAAEAALLIQRGDVDIPGYSPELQPRPVTPAAPLQAGGLPAGTVVNGDGTITLPTSALTPEQREAVRQSLSIEPVEYETTKPPPGDEAALEAAKEYLSQEGMEAEVEKTEAPVVIPEGYSTTTAEGEPRCLAAKADGTQCANAARNGTACGLKKHQEQLQVA